MNINLLRFVSVGFIRVNACLPSRNSLKPDFFLDCRPSEIQADLDENRHELLSVLTAA